MKIAYVLGEYPSLSETFIARDIEALRRRGFEIDIWALQAGEGAWPIPRLSTAQCLMKPLSRFSSGARAKFFRHLGTHWATTEKKALADIQHIHAGWASHPADIARGAAKALGVRWSFSGHARDLWVENEGLAEKLHKAKFAACCTREGTEYLQSLATKTAGKALYAPHGIEISKYQFKAQRKVHDPIRVLAVGRLIEKKGFEKLIVAIAALSSYPRYRFQLSIIGDGPLRAKLEKIARLYRISDSVSFCGALPHAKVIEAMHASDLFVMTSRTAKDGDRDGLPNVLLEAAACGLPIVSTRAGSIADFLDESSAWLSSENESVRFRELIGRAVEMHSDSQQHAKKARTCVEENFDVDRNVEILANAFNAQ